MGVAGLLGRIGIGRTDLTPPYRRVGPFRLLRLLGRGGMGEVWLERHRSTRELAAIKVVRGEAFGANSEERDSSMQRLQREARALERLRSPHVVRFLDSGLTSSGAFYFAMEFLDGVSLDAMVRQLGALDWRTTVVLLRAVASGLDDAHRDGLVHCDVSPANVIVCSSGARAVPKVIDFGLVRSVCDLHRSTEITLPLLAAGTPAYMAPEVILRRPVDR